VDETTIAHIGTKRHSGRYDWGSGEKYEKAVNFLGQVDSMKAAGRSQKDIADSMGLSIKQLRSRTSVANEDLKEARRAKAQELYEAGVKRVDIAKELQISVGTLNNDLRVDPSVRKAKSIDTLTDGLKGLVDEKEYLDIGKGTEVQLGISKERLNAAVNNLKEDGYNVNYIQVNQATGAAGQKTTIKVLSKDDDVKSIYANREKIVPPDLTFDASEIKLKKIHYPEALDKKRVGIVYDEEGGSNRDGLMLIRKGKDDLDLGNSKYAQVRINVDDKSYLKGMAMYGDDSDFPAGVDVKFYTNKKKGTPVEKVLKDLKPDPNNPFGAQIKSQNGKLNIVNEEGDWESWSAGFSSQFLSKQPVPVIKERLAVTMARKQKEFDEINALTNPTIKKHLMEQYADSLDGAAASLKAVGYPKTQSHVLLPFPDMKPNEVYAPNFKNGDKVILVRHPHGGTFEIPSLTVNNNGPAKKLLGNAKDAIGIHPSQAQKLSGADFDGDTVLVIPNKSGKLKYRDSLEGLRNFEPKDYAVEGLAKNQWTIKKKQQQTEMGKVSNLITDMTIQNAPDADIVRAIKHSMVVIDARKHKLDWKASEEDNSIKALQSKYQKHVVKVEVEKFGTPVKKNGVVEFEPTITYNPKDKKGNPKTTTGAATLISNSKKEVTLYDAASVYSYTDSKLKTPKEKTRYKKGTTVKLMDIIDDANTLSSGSKVETEYANYANSVKKLAKKAHTISETTKGVVYNPKAAKLYANELASLNDKLKKAISNKPRERRAQNLADLEVTAKIKSYKTNNPDEPKMDADDLKKIKSQAIAKYRVETGAQSNRIDITAKEWEAIQAGAVSDNRLKEIMNSVNDDKLKALATPKAKNNMPASSIATAKTLLSRGYTYAEVAEQLGVSASTIMANTKN